MDYLNTKNSFFMDAGASIKRRCLLQCFYVFNVNVQGNKRIKANAMIAQELHPAEREALEAVKSQHGWMVEHVLQWSACNSHSRNLDGLQAMAQHLEQVFSLLPGKIERRAPTFVEAVDANGHLSPLAHGEALYMQVRPKAPIQVLLAGHMDTVFPKDSAFQTPRFLSDSVINGPGVADMKGGLLVMLQALRCLETSPWAHALGYQVIINADEEVSSLGSAALLEEAARTAQLGLVYEPAQTPEGLFAGARKGIGNYALIAQGKSAHAGRNPEEGRNAIAAVAEFFVQAHALNGAREGVNVNVARIDGGAPTNVVPERAVGRFEARVWRHEDREWLEAQLHRLAQEVAQRHDVPLSLKGNFHRPPKPLDAATASLFASLKLCGADLGLPVGWRASGGCCDGNNLAAAGLPVIDTLGVRGGLIHSDQEFVHVESLVERAQLSALLLMRLARGSVPLPAQALEAGGA
jgi:glutamate carboxypeptidase